MTATGLRLFCFPYAGGRNTIYRDWREHLPAGVEVRAVELPGRGRRLSEPLRTDIAALAADAAEVMSPELDRPFALFGHSMGALIAFELARHFEMCGGMLRRLYVSGRRAPHLPDPDPPTYALPEPEFVDELRRLAGTPAEFFEHVELMRVMLPIIRADFQAVQTYRYLPGPLLRCPIVAFGGTADHRTGEAPVGSWREQTSAAFAAHMVPGDHFFLQSNRALLLSLLAADLRAALTQPEMADCQRRRSLYSSSEP